MNVVSLFSGAGGMDLGFENAGFFVEWANEHDRYIWDTYGKNHPNTTLDKRSIVDIPFLDIPECDGIIGGPPCQSWSAAGTLRGIHDNRGRLFYDFIRIIREKKPLFFVAENVSGMLSPRHHAALLNIKDMLTESGYELSLSKVNAADYGVPQDRKRVFFVGYRNDLEKTFIFPPEVGIRRDLKSAIKDLEKTAIPAMDNNRANGDSCLFPNHEYHIGGFSSIYMQRNRVRGWNEPSFTIQASGRHAPLHPRAPRMLKVHRDLHQFVPDKEHMYRRLTVRECARVQTFPDSYEFVYHSLSHGYKMVGNAVPVDLAQIIAEQIRKDLSDLKVL